jgi:hypothetical protein
MSFSSKMGNSCNFPIVWAGNLHGKVETESLSFTLIYLYVDRFLIGEKFPILENPSSNSNLRIGCFDQLSYTYHFMMF